MRNEGRVVETVVILDFMDSYRSLDETKSYGR